MFTVSWQSFNDGIENKKSAVAFVFGPNKLWEFTLLSRQLCSQRTCSLLNMTIKHDNKCKYQHLRSDLVCSHNLKGIQQLTFFTILLFFKYCACLTTAMFSPKKQVWGQFRMCIQIEINIMKNARNLAVYAQ